MSRIGFHIIAIICFFILSNCNKIEAPNAEAAKIFGQWTYKSNTGGFSGAGGSTRFPAGSIVEFTENGVFNVYLGSNTISTEHYTLAMKPNIYSVNDAPAIVYQNGSYEIFEIDGNQLELSENVYDGFTYLFEKL